LRILTKIHNAGLILQSIVLFSCAVGFLSGVDYIYLICVKDSL